MSKEVKRAVVVKKNTCMGNKVQTEEEEDLWYMARDGSFFEERRKPFFLFNFLAYAATFSFFTFLAVAITRDYYNQLDGPPSASRFLHDPDLGFPGIIVCNSDYKQPLFGLVVRFEHAYEKEVEANPLPCNPACHVIDSAHPAYRYDDETGECQSPFALRMTAYTTSWNKTVDRVEDGLVFSLFKPNHKEKIIEEFCYNAQGTCESWADTTEDCSGNIADLSVDSFAVPSAFVSRVQLTKTRKEFSPACGQFVTSWNPVPIFLNFGVAYLKEEVSEDAAALGMTEDEWMRDVGYTVVRFMYSTPKVEEITYNPTSAVSFFGSLAGWFGICTDGWGLVSILFLLERVFLFLKYRARREPTDSNSQQFAL